MTETHMNALPAGHRIDEYEIVRVLGAGGFGITYLAFDHNLRAPVAVKEYFHGGLARRTSRGAVVPHSASKRKDFEWGRARFLDEARLLARLQHPNIVQVRRCVEANGTAYLAMDYVEGQSLAVVLEKHGTLTPQQWRRWMEPLLDGLQHVHRRNCLYRDVRPENIVIRAADGESVLVDFGSDRAWLEALDHGLKLRPEERPATVDAWRTALEHTRGARNSTIATMPQRFRKRIASAAIAATKRTAAIARDQRLAVRAMRLPRHALPIAAAIAGAVCLAALLSPTAPTLTADGSHATRSIAAGANTRPRTASIQPRHQRLARAPSRRPAAASAPSTSPGARVGNATAAGRQVPAPPAPRESSSPPVTASPAAAASLPASPPVAASPVVAASPPGSPPGARVGDTTVIGWRVVDPQAPRPAPSPRPTTAPPPPAPSSPPTEPVRVGGNISPPTRTRNVRPVYPPHARSARVEGSVILEAVIGPTGRVTDVKVLRSAPLLDEAAMEAVLQWEYTPTLLNGVPVPVIMTVTVSFTL